MSLVHSLVEDKYEVNITPEWLKDENEWDLPVTERETYMSEDGTVIVVGDLHQGIINRFYDDADQFSI